MVLHFGDWLLSSLTQCTDDEEDEDDDAQDEAKRKLKRSDKRQ